MTKGHRRKRVSHGLSRFAPARAVQSPQLTVNLDRHGLVPVVRTCRRLERVRLGQLEVQRLARGVRHATEAERVIPVVRVDAMSQCRVEAFASLELDGFRCSVSLGSCCCQGRREERGEHEERCEAVHG